MVECANACVVVYTIRRRFSCDCSVECANATTITGAASSPPSPIFHFDQMYNDKTFLNSLPYTICCTTYWNCFVITTTTNISFRMYSFHWIARECETFYSNRMNSTNTKPSASWSLMLRQPVFFFTIAILLAWIATKMEHVLLEFCSAVRLNLVTLERLHGMAWVL